MIRCSRCNQNLDPEAFAPSHRQQGDWCRACRREYNRAYNAAHYEPHPRARKPRPELTPRVLITHGGKPGGTRWRKIQEQVWSEETNCGICGQPVDQSLHHQERMARCVDHIVPIALGGAMYERTNVRLAHRSCNARASLNVTTERLALSRAATWIGTQLL